MFYINVADYLIKLGEVWLLSHTVLRLWFTVIFYQTCVQGDGVNVGVVGRWACGSDV